MSSRRVLKVSEAIREVVGMAILRDISDPRVQGVTVIRAEVTPDLREAKVYVSIMGDEAKQKLCLHGLKSAAGFLQSKIAARIDTRYTPKIEFVVDMGVKKSIEIASILKRVLPSESTGDAAADEFEEDNLDGDTIDDDSLDAEANDDEMAENRADGESPQIKAGPESKS